MIITKKMFSCVDTTLGSWIWPKLLKLRDEIRTFLRAEVNDGVSVSFWLDHWLPMGRLIDLTGEAGPRFLGISITATVKEALGQHGWRVRRTRVAHTVPITEQLRAQPLPTSSNGSDIYLWRHGGLAKMITNIFSQPKHKWDQLRSHSRQKNWSKVVWFKQGIPQCGYITWLAVRDRLATGMRMRSWGHEQP